MSKEIYFFEQVTTPPMGVEARRETGFLLRMLQEGEKLGMPMSRPMPAIGRGCHELRVREEGATWRIVYYLGRLEIVVLKVFQKRTQETPRNVIDLCKERLRRYRKALKD